MVLQARIVKRVKTMKKSQKTLQVGIAAAIIVGTIVALAFTGNRDSQSYYVKIDEVLTPKTKSLMGDNIHHRQLRVEGFVVPGSIQQDGTNATFTLNEFESHSVDAANGRTLKVVYKGTEPPPDTFKDNAMALAIGTYGYDGVLHANTLQAKCASKYAPASPNQPGATPAAQPSPATKTAANTPAGDQTAAVR
jgi:cytochrome c-type biogenesis protein CcmE